MHTNNLDLYPWITTRLFPQKQIGIQNSTPLNQWATKDIRVANTGENLDQFNVRICQYRIGKAVRNEAV